MLGRLVSEIDQYQFSVKVVGFGGGTGLPTFIRGCVRINNPEYCTFVPTSWDDGSSTGRLRDETGSMPAGDARRCLMAAMTSDRQRVVYQKLSDDRLQDHDGPFKGHSVMNLELMRLEKIFHGPDRALEAARELYLVKSKILYPALTDLRLIAQTQSGIVIEGETNIDNRKLRSDFKPNDRIARLWFNTEPDVNPAVPNAVNEADLIVISSGDTYTSCVPHLLIQETRDAILESKAPLALVLNLMTKPGETDDYKASDHLKAHIDYLGSTQRVNYLIANQNGLDPEILEIYKNDGQIPVSVDEEECYRIAPNLKIISKPLAYYHREAHLLRHDPIPLAQTVLSLASI